MSKKNLLRFILGVVPVLMLMAFRVFHPAEIIVTNSWIDKPEVIVCSKDFEGYMRVVEAFGLVQKLGAPDLGTIMPGCGEAGFMQWMIIVMDPPLPLTSSGKQQLGLTVIRTMGNDGTIVSAYTVIDSSSNNIWVAEHEIIHGYGIMGHVPLKGHIMSDNREDGGWGTRGLSKAFKKMCYGTDGCDRR